MEKPLGIVNRTILQSLSAKEFDLDKIKKVLKQKYGIILSETALRQRVAGLKKFGTA